MVKSGNYNKSKKPKVSNGVKIGLYIPCYNAERYIGEVLEAVFKQSLSPDKVVVVDDSSTDNTVEIVKDYPVKVIRHKRNRGLAACRNTAIKNMRVKFIASLDSDCLPDHKWLGNLMASLGSSDLAGAGGKLKERYSDAPCDLWRSVHMKQHWGSSKDEPPFLFGSNTVFNREALLKAGLYNEGLGNNYEDVDICNRLKKKGCALIYAPAAVCYHLKRDNLYSLLNDYWGWHRAYYEKKSFYRSKERFKFKLKDSLGLANRYMEEDKVSGRKKLLYLDFLFAIHHCFRDLEYFCYRGNQQDLRNPRLSCWLSLIDLSLFYHLDASKDSLSTLIPKNAQLPQNLLALNLVLAKLIQSDFKSPGFKKMLYEDLLISLYNIEDKHLSGKLSDMVDLHSEWDKLLKKKQSNLNALFLKTLALTFRNWIGCLGLRFPGIFKEIEASANHR